MKLKKQFNEYHYSFCLRRIFKACLINYLHLIYCGDILAERGFSLYDIEQFIREAGAERVTEDAVVDLELELERLTEKIAERALKYAEHAGRRKLIRGSDVLLIKK